MMNIKKLAALASLVLSSWALTSSAAFAGDVAKVLDALRQRYPATQFGSVAPSLLPGIFEVAMGKNIIYTDESGRYFLFGHLYDMQLQRDLTAERKEQVARIDFAALPLKDAMVKVKGSGSRKLAVFSDPDCPYCKKLEQEISALNDVTVYTFLFPIEGLHPDAANKSLSIWCSKDPAGAWEKLMLQGKLSPSKDCDNPLARNIRLAESLDIHGTPTMISGDGRVLPGAATATQIDKFLMQAGGQQ